MADHAAMIRNIVKEIIRECVKKNVPVYDSFINYYVKLLYLDPKWKISAKMEKNRSDVQNFIKFVVTTLEKNETISFLIIKMQFYFTCNFDNRSEIGIRNRKELLNCLKPLENEITEIKHSDDISKLYKRISYYVTLAAGMGNPIVEGVFKEANAALKSVLFENELKEFLKFSKSVKEEKLVELTKLVTGIRLFHRDNEKGGEGIEDLPALLKKSIESTTKELQNVLVHIMDKVNLFTTILDNYYQIEKDWTNSYCIVQHLHEGVSLEFMENVKDILTLYRQYELYIRRIIDEIKEIDKKSVKIQISFKTALNSLNETVKNRIAIPAYQVFPLFNKVTEAWFEYQDEIILLAKLNQMSDNLEKYVKKAYIDENILQLLIDQEGPLTDIERFEKTTGSCIELRSNSKAEIVDLESLKDLDQIHFEYLGFCGWKLVETQGALIPGNPNLGIIKTMNMYYVFSTIEAAESFCEFPERYILEAIEVVRSKPELVEFLNLREHLELVQDITELVIKPPKTVQTIECEIQTELHPTEENIVPKYKWNIWDFKREAIMLANLASCQTKSVQTTSCGGKFQISTQTYGTKDQNEQTKKDGYSNVPTLSNFIYGLRGRKDDKQFVIQLTRPVKE